MLRPTDIEALKGDLSRYAVVIGVAKRAREIAERAEQDGTILIEKTVSLAIENLKGENYKIVMETPTEETETAVVEEAAECETPAEEETV